MYELPLTVRIDTLIAPARFVPEPGVTLEDLEQARAQMPEGWVPVDSWNTPGNLFGLCALFCIGAFTDRETATCRFDSQEFCDYLTWCKRWGGDGSTPDSPETTLVGLGWISSVSWLAGRGEYYAKTWGEQGYTYAGFPVESGSGSAYNILTSLGLGPQCSDLDGAKAFFAFCFSYQQENRIPANSALLRAEMEDFMAGNRTDWYGEVELLGESDAAQFYALLETHYRAHRGRTGRWKIFSARRQQAILPAASPRNRRRRISSRARAFICRSNMEARLFSKQRACGKMQIGQS